MSMRHIDIRAPGGTIPAQIFGAGPPVLFLMDAPGVRPVLVSMCQRIAASGHTVLLPNLYWRWCRESALDRCEFEKPDSAERTRIFGMANGLTNAMFAEDLPALLDAMGATPDNPASAVGYCMSGRFAMMALANHPDRVRVAASYYGTRMVLDTPDSPHLWYPKMREGRAYLAFAEDDHYVPLDRLPIIRAALEQGGLRHEIEVYPNTTHGFAFPDSRGYDAPGEARHWETLLPLLRRLTCSS